jgi:nucleoside-diphosphate-sugar epimerase
MRCKIIEEDMGFISNSDIPWEILEGKNILISGASGFLASYLTEAVLFLNDKKFKSKSKVFALVRDRKRAEQRFEEYKNREDLKFIFQDVCESINVNENVDFIIHAASHASPKYYDKDPVGTLDANVTGTRNLLELARKKKVRGFLFISSGAVYGQATKIPTSESDYGYLNPLDAGSCYAESKRMGETMCVSWFRQHNVPVKIVRPFNTYGPGMSFDDGRVHADFVADVVENKNIKVRGGEAIRNFNYIADAIVGFFAVLLKGKNGEAYNIGNHDGEISIKDLANMLIKLYPEKKLKVEFEEGIKSRVNEYNPDLNKIYGLGWKPCHSLKEGFLRTIRSYSK